MGSKNENVFIMYFIRLTSVDIMYLHYIPIFPIDSVIIGLLGKLIPIIMLFIVIIDHHTPSGTKIKQAIKV